MFRLKSTLTHLSGDASQTVSKALTGQAASENAGASKIDLKRPFTLKIGGASQHCKSITVPPRMVDEIILELKLEPELELSNQDLIQTLEDLRAAKNTQIIETWKGDGSHALEITNSDDRASVVTLQIDVNNALQTLTIQDERGGMRFAQFLEMLPDPRAPVGSLNQIPCWLSSKVDSTKITTGKKPTNPTFTEEATATRQRIDSPKCSSGVPEIQNASQAMTDANLPQSQAEGPPIFPSARVRNHWTSYKKDFKDLMKKCNKVVHDPKNKLSDLPFLAGVLLVQTLSEICDYKDIASLSKVVSNEWMKKEYNVIVHEYNFMLRDLVTAMLNAKRVTYTGTLMLEDCPIRVWRALDKNNNVSALRVPTAGVDDPLLASMRRSVMTSNNSVKNENFARILA